MHIELVKKEVSWCGDKGIRMNITARGRVTTEDPTTSSTRSVHHGASSTIIDPIEIYLYGMDTPTVSINLGSCVSVHQVVKGERGISIEISPYVGKDHTSRDEWIAVVHDWIEAQGLRQEWEEEAIRYRGVLSQIDLPGNSMSVYSEPADSIYYTDQNIIYRLVAGGDDFHIFIIVEARHAKASVCVGIVQADDLRENYIYVGEYSLTYPINSDSVKAVVGPAITQFMGKLNALLELPLMP